MSCGKRVRSAVGRVVGDRTGAEAWERDGARRARGLGDPAALIAEEEVELVLEHRATDRTAKLVADQWRAWKALVVVEPVIRLHGSITVIFIERTMKVVRTALRDHLELSTAALTRARELAGYKAMEFLHGVDRRIGNDRLEVARLVVVDVQSVECDVRLVDTGTGGRAGRCDAGQQRKQGCRRVTILHWQIV